MACDRETEVCCQEIFVGDEGLPIQFYIHTCDETTDPHTETPLDVSSATVMDIFLLDPNGVKSSALTGSFVTDGTDGLVEYITTQLTLNLAGPWQGQLQITLASGRKNTSKISFSVSEPL